MQTRNYLIYKRLWKNNFGGYKIRVKRLQNQGSKGGLAKADRVDYNVKPTNLST